MEPVDPSFPAQEEKGACREIFHVLMSTWGVVACRFST
jgi:hypothetical protein